MAGVVQRLVRRLADVLHAGSDADHRARGWQVRRGEWGGRRYRLDVAAWLDKQMDRAGEALTAAPSMDADGNEWGTRSNEARSADSPSPVLVLIDECPDLFRNSAPTPVSGDGSGRDGGVA